MTRHARCKVEATEIASLPFTVILLFPTRVVNWYRYYLNKRNILNDGLAGLISLTECQCLHLSSRQCFKPSIRKPAVTRKGFPTEATVPHSDTKITLCSTCFYQSSSKKKGMQTFRQSIFTTTIIFKSLEFGFFEMGSWGARVCCSSLRFDVLQFGQFGRAAITWLVKWIAST